MSDFLSTPAIDLFALVAFVSGNVARYGSAQLLVESRSKAVLHMDRSSLLVQRPGLLGADKYGTQVSLDLAALSMAEANWSTKALVDTDTPGAPPLLQVYLSPAAVPQVDVAVPEKRARAVQAIHVFAPTGAFAARPSWAMAVLSIVLPWALCSLMGKKVRFTHTGAERMSPPLLLQRSQRDAAAFSGACKSVAITRFSHEAKQLLNNLETTLFPQQRPMYTSQLAELLENVSLASPSKTDYLPGTVRLTDIARPLTASAAAHAARRIQTQAAAMPLPKAVAKTMGWSAAKSPLPAAPSTLVRSPPPFAASAAAASPLAWDSLTPMASPPRRVVRGAGQTMRSPAHSPVRTRITRGAGLRDV